MKQGKRFMKVIMLVLALMVASYILYNVVQSASRGAATVQAVLYAASDGVSTEGLLVRQETVIPSDYNLVLPTKSEGEKVAAGAEVAVSLRSEAARERQAEIVQTEQDLEQLRLALTYQNQLTDSAAVSEQISASAAEFAGQVALGRLENAQGTGQNLKALILRQSVGGSDTKAIQAQITELQRKLTELQASSAADIKSIAVQQAGYYSAVVDGYESLLTPEVLETVTVEEFQDLYESTGTPATAGQGAGRLIASSQWYYACAVESRYLKDVEVGDTLQVALGGEVDQELEMTVIRVNREGETGLLVLSSADRLSAVSALRRLNADVIFHSYYGLRVPREAVCYSEESGSAGVYVLVGTKAVWKDIQLLYDSGDTYIAALDQSSTTNLWPEDLILLDTQGLFDGKLVN